MSQAFDKARMQKIAEHNRGLFDALVVLIRAQEPAFEESIKWGNLTFHFGTQNCISIWQPKNAERLNLQFFNGNHLDNASGLLEGTGKDLRHIKMTNLAMLDAHQSAIEALVRECSAKREMVSS